MKKVKLIIAAVGMLGLVSSSTVYADGFSAGEGLYVGAFGGIGSGIVQPKVITNGKITTDGLVIVDSVTVLEAGSDGSGGNIGGTFEATEGGLGLLGIEGGGWIGYGYKMGDLYAGIEGEMATGDVSFKVTSDVPIILQGSAADGGLKTLTEIEATKDWTGGMFGRLGFYINKETLLAFRGGVLVSKFELNTAGTNNALTEDFYGGGSSVGASLESRITALDPNLSIRMDTVYTDYLTANVFGISDNTAANDSTRGGHDSEVTGAALSARIGLQYSFFDVNSLF